MTYIFMLIMVLLPAQETFKLWGSGVKGPTLNPKPGNLNPKPERAFQEDVRNFAQFVLVWSIGAPLAMAYLWLLGSPVALNPKPFSLFWGSRFPYPKGYKVTNPRKGALIILGYWATKATSLVSCEV